MYFICIHNCIIFQGNKIIQDEPLTLLNYFFYVITIILKVNFIPCTLSIAWGYISFPYLRRSNLSPGLVSLRWLVSLDPLNADRDELRHHGLPDCCYAWWPSDKTFNLKFWCSFSYNLCKLIKEFMRFAESIPTMFTNAPYFYSLFCKLPRWHK